MNPTSETEMIIDDSFAWIKDIKISPNIEPFLKMLWDHGLINCDTNPEDSTLETRIKVQKFVYFAQKYFGLDFQYNHVMYIYGPYSLDLTGDYFHIRNIRDIPNGGLERWGKREEFLDFAKNHNSTDWLDVASTIIYSRFDDNMKDADMLVKHVQLIKGNFQKEFVVRVRDELVQMGFLEE